MLERFSDKYPESLLLESSIVGFSIFPNTENEVDNQDMKLLISQLRQYYKEFGIEWDSPVALHPNKKGKVKLRRALRTGRFQDWMKLKGFDLFKAKGNRYGSISIDYGEGSRGGRGAKSKGFKFEDQLANDMRNWVRVGFDKKMFNYPDIVEGLVKQFDLEKANTVEIIMAGTEDTKRPLVFKPNPEIYNQDSGRKISDLTLRVDGKDKYLSLKFGKSTLTLFNIGVRNFYKPKDMKNEEMSLQGQKILDMFGIDADLFMRVFNEFGETDFKEYHTTVKKNKQVEKFIETGFGLGYWTVHQKGRDYDMYEMNNKMVKDSSKLITDMTIRYGGAGGKAKQVGILFETKTFKFNIKFRNSAGGIYPTHLFGEYKKK